MHPLVHTSLITIAPSASTALAAELMAHTRIGSLLVVDDTGRLTGILTGRDLVVRMVATGDEAREVTVSQVMSASPSVCSAERADDLIELARSLARAKVRRLPIVDEEHRPVGIIACEDILVHVGRVLHALGQAVASDLSIARLRTTRTPT